MFPWRTNKIYFNYRIKSKEFQKTAKTIVSLFATEHEATYYLKSQNSINPAGKLRDAYHNLRNTLQTVSLISKVESSFISIFKVHFISFLILVYFNYFFFQLYIDYNWSRWGWRPINSAKGRFGGQLKQLHFIRPLCGQKDHCIKPDECCKNLLRLLSGNKHSLSGRVPPGMVFYSNGLWSLYSSVSVCNSDSAWWIFKKSKISFIKTDCVSS